MSNRPKFNVGDRVIIAKGNFAGAVGIIKHILPGEREYSVMLDPFAFSESELLLLNPYKEDNQLDG